MSKSKNRNKELNENTKTKSTVDVVLHPVEVCKQDSVAIENVSASISFDEIETADSNITAICNGIVTTNTSKETTAVFSTATSTLVKIARTRKYAIVPTKAHASDAGYDFYMPNPKTIIDNADRAAAITELVNAIQSLSTKVTIAIDNSKPASQTDAIIGFNIAPNGRICVPTGIVVGLPDLSARGFNAAMIAFNKSGIATKSGLLVGACVIDAGYRGEVHINLINTNKSDITVLLGQKLTQFIYMQLPATTLTEVSLDDINKPSCSRGNGAFGSTGLF